MRGGRRKGSGRPKGSRKLPDEYSSDLRNLLNTWKPGTGPTYYSNIDFIHGTHDSGLIRPRHVSQMCLNIGEVKWIDRATGEVVHKIDNWKTLRSRLLESWQPLKIIYTGSWTTSLPRSDEQPVARGPIVVTDIRKAEPPEPRKTVLKVGKRQI
jgi:hypothetical protein